MSSRISEEPARDIMEGGGARSEAEPAELGAASVELGGVAVGGGARAASATAKSEHVTAQYSVMLDRKDSAYGDVSGALMRQNSVSRNDSVSPLVRMSKVVG
jgi:hypothetical protein